MNAVLNINIRVASQQAAAQIGAIKSAISGLQQAGAGGTANLTSGFSQFGGALSTVGSSMVSFGKNLSWTGRQLQQTFTVPILAAGGAATYFAMRNEAAFTQVKKVYDIAGGAAGNLQGELDQLNRSMELLSDTFGVSQDKVSGVAKAWAEAGSAGVGLQKSVFISLEAAAVGSIDLDKATEGLIAIQSAYRLNTDQLRLALAQLNTIQVQSGISFSGMIDVVSRAGGVAKTAGIDIQHLAAMAAAIVPAAGTASQAGNALKTIISRLLAPTKQATEMLHDMGIEVDSTTWQAKNGSQRLEAVAAAFGKLSDAQKTIASSTIASRFQINRFDILMDDVNRSTGFYQRSLGATADSTKTLAIYQKQLLTVLESSPQRMKILWTMLQNALAKIIIPLLPTLLGLIARIVGLVQWFSKLNPHTQQFIMLLALGLAVFGPFIRYIAVTIELFGLLFKITGNVITSVAKLISWYVALQARQAAQTAANAQLAASQAAAAQSAAAAAVASAAAGAGAAANFTAAWMGVPAALGASTVAGVGTVTNIWVNGMAAIGAATGSLALGVGGAAGAAVAPWVAAMLELETTTTTVIPIVESEFLALEAGPQMLALGMGEASAAIKAALAEVVTELESTGAIWASVPAEVTPLWEAGAAGIVQTWSVAMGYIEAITLETIGSISTAWSGAIAALGAGTVAESEVLQGELVADAAVATGSLAAIDTAIVATVVSMAELGAGALAVSEVLQAEFIADAAVVDTALASIDASIIDTYLVMGELPVVTGVAATETVGVFATMAAGIGEAVAAIAAFIATLPLDMIVVIGLIIASIAILAYHFRKDLGDAFQWIVTQLTKLPGYFMSAFSAIVRVVQNAMSMLFGGPSATDAATKQATQQGMAAAQTVTKAPKLPKPGQKGFIGPVQTKVPAAPKKSPLEEFMDNLFKTPDNVDGQVDAATKAAQDAANKLQAGLDGIGPGKGKKVLSPESRLELEAYIKLMPSLDAVLNQNTGDIKAQGQAIDNWNKKLSDATDTVKIAGERLQLLEVAPDAVPTLDALIARLGPLKTLMADLDTQLQAQQAVVDGWKTKLDAANVALQNASDQLTILKDVASDAKSALDDAQTVLDNLANTPIEGMKAMDDAIFANSMEVKALKLQIMQLEDAGGSIEDINKKLGLLRGTLETLKSERETLRLAGAGSEILGPLDEQIKAVTDSIDSLEGTGAPITALTDQLNKLQRQGDEMDLTKSLKFDPLTKQIKDATTTLKEMPFDEIMTGITNQKGIVADLTTKWNDATAAVDKQQDIVNKLKITRDGIQQTYDTENAKLATLKDNYDNVKGAVDGLTNAIQGMIQTASAGTTDLSDMFNAAKAGDFGDVGGISQIGREGGLPDMKAFNDALQKSVEDMGASMGKIDIWQPFKDMFSGIGQWILDHGPQIMAGLVAGIAAIFAGVPLSLVAVIIVAVAALAPLLWQWIQQAWGWVMDHKAQTAAAIAAGILAILLGAPLALVAIIAAAVLVLGPIVWDWINRAWDWVMDHKLQTAAAIAAGILAILLGAPLALAAIVAAAVLVLGPVVWGWINSAWDWVMDHKLETIGFIAAGILIMLFGVPAAVALLIGSAVAVLAPTIWGWLQSAWQWVMDNKLTLIAAIAAGVIAILLGAPAAIAALIGAAVLVLGPTLLGWIKSAWHYVQDHVGDILAGVDWVKILGLESIGAAFSSIWDRIKRDFALVVNFFVDAINTLIHAVNAVTGLLKIPAIPDIPKIDVPKAATGGVFGKTAVDAMGMITNVPRAIVGEGSNLYPEYVIPTDPRHRANALKLYQSLGTQLMAGGGLVGGIVSGVGDALSGVGGALSSVGGWTVDKISEGLRGLQKGVVTAVAQPFLAATDVAIDLIPSAFFQNVAKGLKNEIYNWMKGDDIPKAYNGALIKGSTRGTLIRAGDGNKDEAIVPFPSKQMGGDTNTYHFHGDLSFPNIRSGEDADRFLKNLERLVG